MSNIIWKPFALSDLFTRETPPSTNTPAKNIKVYSENGDGRIALITRGKTNNGVVGFVDKGSFETAKNVITYNDQFGLTLYHDYEFTTIKDHLSILKCKNNQLAKILDSNPFINVFICCLVNKLLTKSVYDFNYSPSDFRFDREIILLPCVVCEASESVWNLNGKYLTVDVDYISNLMEKAKKARESALNEQENAIKKEAEKTILKLKKELESLKVSKENIIWKPFALSDLFTRETPPSTNTPAKNIKVYTENGEGRIALITRGKTNNGVVGFVDKGTFETAKNVITYNDQFGLTLYHEYEFTTIKDHLSILKCKSNELAKILDSNPVVNIFLCCLINKLLTKSLYDFNYNPSDFRFDREIILLPCKQCEASTSIWNLKGKYLTVDIDYIGYLMKRGEVYKNEKLL